MTRVVHVLSTESFPPEWLAEVEAVSPRVCVDQHPPPAPPEALARAEVLCKGGPLPDVAAAPALRWVQLDTSGADHVARGWRADVAVTSIGGVSGRPLAEYVLMMDLAAAHRLPAVLGAQRARAWPADNAKRWARFRPAQVAGATLVAVGYGRLARAIGRLARVLDLGMVGVRRGGARAGERSGVEDGDAPGVEVMGADALHAALARADYVAVCVPLTAETRGLLGETALRALKPGAVLIAVSRGGVVDEAAMRAALDDGRLAWVAADVFAQEPLPPESLLWADPRVFVTPHVAGLAPDYAEQVGRLLRANLARYLEGRALLNVINRDLRH